MNAETKFRTEDTWPDHCRKRDAINAVKDRYWSLRNKLAERMWREIARIERGEQ